MTSVELFAPGTPAPQGSKRHIGHGRMVEMSKRLKPWRAAVRAALLQAADPRTFPIFPRETPVLAELVFTIAAPQRLPKSRPTWPIRQPDLDKLVRSTFDAISDSGIWGDDAQVIRLIAEKTYPTHAITATGQARPTTGCHIRLSQAGAHR